MNANLDHPFSTASVTRDGLSDQLKRGLEETPRRKIW